MRDRQARESVRRCRRSAYRRCLRARLCHGSHVGLRWHHRLQSRTRCRNGAGDHREAVRGDRPRQDGARRRCAKKNVRVLACGLPMRSAPCRACSSRLAAAFSCRTRTYWRSVRLEVVSKRAPEARELADLRFAWTVAQFVKSNAIVYARDNVVGVGAGQMSRVYSALPASSCRRRHRGGGRHGLRRLLSVPRRNRCSRGGYHGRDPAGGSMRDQEVIAAADDAGGDGIHRRPALPALMNPERHRPLAAVVASMRLLGAQPAPRAFRGCMSRQATLVLP